MNKRRVVIVGSTGTIGREIKGLLAGDYEIIEVNRSSGDYQLNIEDRDALEKMFDTVGEFDALICTGGYAKWGTMDEHTPEDYNMGINSKLMGQVNLVELGKKHAKKGASFVLTSGVLAHHAMVGGISIAMVNSAVEAFVRGAALEMENFTVTAISPSFAKETMELMGMDSSSGVPAAEFASLYKKAIEENRSGTIYAL